LLFIGISVILDIINDQRRDTMIKLGSHVGMSGKKMMLGSVEEALSYGANTFMIYTGAPQNTKRKELSELNIEAAQALMKENGTEEFIVHAPYIINLANTVKPETYELAVDFLRLELNRATAMGSRVLVLHPGAHVGAGVDAGIASIVKGLNEVLTDDTDCYVALETMAGKGSEIGRNFKELARIYDGVTKKERL
jgi:deoxyribonuclease-4